MSDPKYIPLVEVTRGPIVESTHYGAIAVCDPQGNLVAHAGDADAVVFLRSSSKPFQILPLLELGGMERFNLTERELAVMCASHSGTDDHAQVVAGIQKKLGVSTDDMLCGIHAPTDPSTAERMLLNHEENSPLRHNCSGKHTGMLAQALLQGVPTADYINPQHPVQRRIIQTFSEMTGVPVEQILLGTDGCSAPVFAVPLRSAAHAFARLADPSALPEPRRSALQRVYRAMTSHPDMISGPDTFDTNLMIATRGSVLTKGGAEGYQAAAIPPAEGRLGYGITLKISDGDPTGRARSTALVEILRQLHLLTPQMEKELGAYLTRPVYNWRRVEVGETRATFSL